MTTDIRLRNRASGLSATEEAYWGAEHGERKALMPQYRHFSVPQYMEFYLGELSGTLDPY